jgi:hypothetical protein
LYCPGGYVFGAKPNLITCVAEFFLSVEENLKSENSQDYAQKASTELYVHEFGFGTK